VYFDESRKNFYTFFLFAMFVAFAEEESSPSKKALFQSFVLPLTEEVVVYDE